MHLIPSFCSCFGRVDPFPGGGDFDQHAFAIDPALLVKLDQLPAFVDRAFGIERKPRIGLGRDAARDDLENLAAELHEQIVDHVLDLRRAAKPAALAVGDHFLEQMTVLLLLRRGVNQARISRRILRLEILDRLEVAGIGDDLGELVSAARAGLLVFGSERGNLCLLGNGRLPHGNTYASGARSDNRKSRRHVAKAARDA